VFYLDFGGTVVKKVWFLHENVHPVGLFEMGFYFSFYLVFHFFAFKVRCAILGFEVVFQCVIRFLRWIKSTNRQ